LWAHQHAEWWCCERSLLTTTSLFLLLHTQQTVSACWWWAATQAAAAAGWGEVVVLRMPDWQLQWLITALLLMSTASSDGDDVARCGVVRLMD
jgi:hypothetical protein